VTSPPSTDSAGPPDPLALLRQRSYLGLLLFGAVIGVPVAVIAFWFLKSVSSTQTYLFTTLPKQMGFVGAPPWWPIPILVVGGIITALAVAHLPGGGGHRPAEGFKPAGGTPPSYLPGVVIAAFATLASGAVLGPEAPLIAIGGGLGLLAIHLVRRDAPQMATLVIGAAGSFAAISTLLGSPIIAAFLLMEAAGLGGPLLGLVLLPGLLAAGIGSLIFVGLGSWTGYGTFSLAIPNLPPFHTPDASEFLWALVIGAAAALFGTLIRRGAFSVQAIVDRHRVVLTALVGVAVGLLAFLFFEWSGHSEANVLFSGQTAVPSLVDQASTWSVGALGLLLACKGLAYAGCLGSFRGGPIFPSIFLGAAGGILLSHLPGLPMVAAVGMGIGAMTTVMMGGLPLTSVLLGTLLLQSDAIALTPLVIVAVVVAYVASARLAPVLLPQEAPAAGASP
jgi:H+/Cl- antiporter ClcA